MHQGRLHDWGRMQAAAALVAALGCSRAPQPATPPATLPPGTVQLTQAQLTAADVQVAPAALVEVGARVVTSGRVTYNDLLVSHTTSPVSGRLTRIMGQFGQAVRRGTPLAVIESPDMGMASSDVDKARADQTQAELELARQKSLLAAHAAPERDYENALDAFQRAKIEYERALKKMRLFDADPNAAVSQNYTLRSAIDGEIISRTAFLGAEIQGQYAGGNTCDLFVVANLREVWVIGDIHEADVGRVQAGQTVSLVVEGVAGETFSGQVDYVADVLDPDTRTARVRCVVQNPQRRLKPDMFANVTIQAPGRRVLGLPRSAVVRLGDKAVAFVAQGSAQAGVRRFERRPLIVDDDPNEQVLVITHGLSLGEPVAMTGAAALAAHL